MRLPRPSPLIHAVALFALTLAAPSMSAAQSPDVFSPGDELPHAERLQPGTQQYVLYMMQGETRQPTTILTRTIERDATGGLGVVRIIQRYDSPGSVNVDSSVVEAGTLSPLSYTAALTAERQQFIFSGTDVNGLIQPDSGDARPVEATFDLPVYNAVVLEDIIRTLPLAEGYAATLPVYNPGRTRIDFTIRVTDQAQLPSASGGTIDAWVVALEGGPVPTFLWIDAKSGDLLRQRSDLPNGGAFWKARIATGAEPVNS